MELGKVKPDIRILVISFLEELAIIILNKYFSTQMEKWNKHPGKQQQKTQQTKLLVNKVSIE